MRWIALVLLVGCGHAVPRSDARVEVAPEERAIALAEGLRVRRVADGVWVFTATGPGGEDANGLVVEAGARSVLVDTGFDAAAMRALLAWARSRERPIGAAMVTSADEDRLGGVPALTAAGVPVFASMRTTELAAARGAPIDTSPLEPDSIPELRWTFTRVVPDPEAIVVWHPPSRTLYGGRFLEAGATSRVGREGHGDRPGWRAALDLVAAAFPEASVVVPGRGEPGTLELVAHTRMLLAECTSDAECAITIEPLDGCECCRCTEPRAMSRVALDAALRMRVSCRPICDGPFECPRCTMPEELERLHATCDRGECAVEGR